MKKLITILSFSCISIIVCATNYYIKIGGNDSNTGLSNAQAWLTITKINTVWAAGTFAPGDSILFNRGDTFTGSIIISESGTIGSPIIISAYGTGADPIITGFTTLSSWTSEGGEIYSKAITSESQTNCVLVDGIMARRGRYPDAGTNLTYTTATSSYIIDPGLGDATDWAGAKVVINKNDWTLDRCTITDHNDDTLRFSNLSSTQTPASNRYYFIQNDLRCVTATNEWYHSISAKKIYIYGNPAAKVVKVATLNYLVNNAAYDYITIEHINFQGSISHAIYCTSASNGWTVKNCSISYAGQCGIYCVGGNNWIIDNNTITQTNSTGLHLGVATCSIIDNNISYCGIIPGQCLGTLTYHATGIYVTGSTTTTATIQYNNLSYTAWSGIQTSSITGVNITENYIYKPMQVLDDGGGIYTGGGSGYSRIFNKNIIINSGVGGMDTSYCRGIYLDAYASNCTVTDNTIINCKDAGIFNGGGINNTYTGNLVYNSLRQFFIDQYSTGTPISGLVIKHNTFVAKATLQYCFWIYSLNTNIPDYGEADSNYYARPIDDDNVIVLRKSSSDPVEFYTLAQWQTYTSLDEHSMKSPIGISDTSKIKFYYNNTKEDSTFLLVDDLLTMDGNKFKGDTVIASYSSAIFLIDPDPDSDPPEMAEITTDTAYYIFPKTITITATVQASENNGTITARGICYSTVGTPTVDSTKTVNGTDEGEFTVTITGLESGATYYLRSYVTNEVGTGYGFIWAIKIPDFSYIKYRGEFKKYGGKYRIYL